MRRVLVAASLLAVLAAPSLAWGFELIDTLQGSTAGTAFGGSIGPDGWTTTGTADSLFYAVPRLVDGSVEITITGLTLERIPLIDHEILSMYEAGYGLSEPMNYNPQFRNNAYKMLVRIYGQNEPSRTGMQKLLYALCPLGAPGYTEGLCPCTAFNEEPFGGDTAFNGGPDTFKVEWSATSARYFRNGSQVHQVDWSSSGFVWGPEQMHVLLGSARNVLAPDVGMPVGVTYSNVIIRGNEGAAGPTCGGGTGGSAGAAGSTGTGGAPGCGPTPISIGAFTPANGSGPAGTVSVSYSHCEGASAFRAVHIRVADSVDPAAPGVTVAYENGMLSLGSEVCAPGEQKTLSGAYGGLNCAGTSVAAAGTALTIDWALAFDTAT
jgi:hypothetical protein